MVATSTEILDQLKTIRRRRQLMWIVWLLYLPLVFLLSRLTDSGRLISYFASGWMALGVMVFGVVTLSKCPRCNSLFHATLLYGNFWARTCIHCGLPLR